METSINVPEINLSEPLISVIVPVYNIEKDLPICIDSICQQDYKNLEIILVDDGSDDHSGLIADQYARENPSHIKVIHQENQGVAIARLNGLRIASGDWIGFVDGDDIIESDMYSRLLYNALSYKAEVSHCGYQSIVNGGERVHYFYNTGKVIVQENYDGVRDLLEGRFVEPSLCNKLFHRTLLRQVIESYDREWNIRINEDLLMNYFLFKKAKRAIYEDFCPYHYISRKTSATRSDFQDYMVWDPVRARRIILEDADLQISDLAWIKYLGACRNAYEMFCKKKKHIEKRRILKKELKKNKDKWYLLEKKEQIRIRMLLTTPALYIALYKFYEKHFQKVVYE